MDAGRYKSATEVARKLARTDRKNPSLKLLLIAAQMRAMQWDAARTQLDRLKRKHPGLEGVAIMEAYWDIAQAKDAQMLLDADKSCEHYRNAIEHYDVALAENPRDLEAIVGRAAAYMGIDEYGAAAEGYFDWLTLDPGSRQAQRTLTELLAAHGLLDEAEFEFSLLPDPIRPTPALVIGRGFIEAERPDDAQRYLDLIAAMEPDSWQHSALDTLMCIDAEPVCDSGAKLAKHFDRRAPLYYDNMIVHAYHKKFGCDPCEDGSTFVQPDLLERVEPDYPAAILSIYRQFDARVVLRAFIDQNGSVKSLRTITSTPMHSELFSKAAREAVRQWRFKPAEFNGVPIPLPLTVVVNFTID